MLKPVVLSPETNLRIWSMYRAAFPRMDDGSRYQEMYNAIMASPNSQVFEGPSETILYLTGLVPGGHSATFHMLNESKWNLKDRDAFLETLREIMDLFMLRKLSVFVVDIPELVSLFGYLGFTKEGRLRLHAMFNGTPADVICFGLLRKELDATEALTEAVS